MWKVWSWQQGRENTKPTPSNWACPTPGVLSVVWHLPLSPKGKSPKWTPGKAGSLLVLPNCWEGNWIQSFWSSIGWNVLRKDPICAKPRWGLFYGTAQHAHRGSRTTSQLPFLWGISFVLFPCICVQSFSWKAKNPFHRWGVLFSAWLYSLSCNTAPKRTCKMNIRCRTFISRPHVKEPRNSKAKMQGIRD